MASEFLLQSRPLHSPAVSSFFFLEGRESDTAVVSTAERPPDSSCCVGGSIPPQRNGRTRPNPQPSETNEAAEDEHRKEEGAAMKKIDLFNDK